MLLGLPKLRKENASLRPIVSFTGAPTYNLSKAEHVFSVSLPEKATIMSEIRKTSQNLSYL